MAACAFGKHTADRNVHGCSRHRLHLLGLTLPLSRTGVYHSGTGESIPHGCGATLEGKIAPEEHFVTPKLERCIAAVGWSADAWRKALDDPEDTEAERLRRMDDRGIEMAVLSLGSHRLP